MFVYYILPRYVWFCQLTTTPSLHPPKSMYARVNKASLLADEKKLIHPSHPHAIYRADLVLLGQPAGEAESTARGPS